MKIKRNMLSTILVFAASAFVVHASQESIIARQARLFGERAQAKGFQCRTQVHTTTGKNIDVSLELDKNLLYRIGLITGSGEKVIHPMRVTLINEAKKGIPVEHQNTNFGSELTLHPLSTGEKILKFELSSKSDYSIVVCANYASLYHTGEKDRVIDDHSHF